MFLAVLAVVALGVGSVNSIAEVTDTDIIAQLSSNPVVVDTVSEQPSSVFDEAQFEL